MKKTLVLNLTLALASAVTFGQSLPDWLDQQVCHGASPCYICAPPAPPDGTISVSQAQMCSLGTTQNNQPGWLCPIDEQKCNPVCPQDSSYDGSQQLCVAPKNQCPQGSSYNPQTGSCQTSVICPQGSSYNYQLGMCEGAPTCPQGASLRGGECVTPQIQQGYLVAMDYYVYDTGFTDQCAPVMASYPIFEEYTAVVPANPDRSCPAGYSSGQSFLQSIGGSYSQPFCISNSGWQSVSTNTYWCPLCNTPQELSRCYDPSTGTYSNPSDDSRIYTDAACSFLYNGHWNSIPYQLPWTGLVTEYYLWGYYINLSYSCPAGTTYNSYLRACVASPICPNGTTYNPSLNACVANATCPQGFSQQNGSCVGNANCPNGFYFNSSINECETAPNWTCPVQGQACYKEFGNYYCSPDTCYNVGGLPTPIPAGNPTQPQPLPQGGPQTTKTCNPDNVTLFAGASEGCRPPGLMTGFSNCCEKKKDWFGLGSCHDSEQKLSTMRAYGELVGGDGQCHYIGEHCIKKIPIVHICVQHQKVYCCYDSALGRIIQEGAHQQLGISWGSPESPNCEGLTIQQFQKIDFSQIDFSGWINYKVHQNLDPTIASKASTAIQNAYQNLQSP